LTKINQLKTLQLISCTSSVEDAFSNIHHYKQK